MKFLILITLSLMSFSAFCWNYGSVTPITTAATVAIQPAVANQGTYITGLQIFNSGTVGSVVSVQSGSTVIWAGYLPGTSATLPVESVQAVFATPLRVFKGQAANFVVATTAASIYVSAQGNFGN